MKEWPSPPPSKLIRLVPWAELKEIVPFSLSQLRRMENAGSFPRRIQLNVDGRKVAWLETELLEWINARQRARAFRGD